MAVNDKKVFLYVGKKGEEGKSRYPTYTDAQIKAFNADEFVLTCGNYHRCLTDEGELENYTNDLLTLAKQVIRCTGKFIWLGIPRPPQPTKTITVEDYKDYANRYLAEFIEPVRDALKKLKTSSGYDYYYTYVQGFYMNDEHVSRSDLWFGVDFSYSDLLSHPQIKMYSMISDKLKTSAYGWKKLLWVPYAGRGGNFHTTYADIA